MKTWNKNRKSQLLKFCLVVSTLLPYLQWGDDNHAFVVEIELNFFQNIFSDFSKVAHPFTFIPLLGQILIGLSLLIKKHDNWYLIGGITATSILNLFLLFISILSLNAIMFVSLLPYFILVFLNIKNIRN